MCFSTILPSIPSAKQFIFLHFSTLNYVILTSITRPVQSSNSPKLTTQTNHRLPLWAPWRTRNSGITWRLPGLRNYGLWPRLATVSSLWMQVSEVKHIHMDKVK